jgi:hypothetical protein
MPIFYQNEARIKKKKGSMAISQLGGGRDGPRGGLFLVKPGQNEAGYSIHEGKRVKMIVYEHLLL